MSNEEKQIEEMAVEFAKINCNPKGCYGCNLCDEYGSLELNCEDYVSYRKMAETFYNKGYRKASEVAREIFAEIEKMFTTDGWLVFGSAKNMPNSKRNTKARCNNEKEDI